jgi:hypothetical protein
LLRRFAPRNDGGGLGSRPKRRWCERFTAGFARRQRKVICLRVTFDRLGGFPDLCVEAEIVRFRGAFDFQKFRSCARLQTMSIQTSVSLACWLVSARSRPPGRGRKNLENLNATPRLLQVLEIPHNPQRILWKNLEKKAPDLEILGKKICRLGARS